MTNSVQVRSKLIKALQLDLVGPTSDDSQYQQESLTQSPTSWYLTGFLAPIKAPADFRSDETANEEIDQGGKNSAGDDEATPEKTAARKGFFPVSIGLSFLLPQEATTFEVTIEWGDYIPEPIIEENQEQTKPKSQKSSPKKWQRLPQKQKQSITLDNQPQQNIHSKTVIDLPDTGGLQLVITNRAVNYYHLVPTGTRSVSLFLVNNRTPDFNLERDQSFIFQASLTIESPLGFVPRPNLKGQSNGDWDEKVADLQYRDDYEFVVGHNVSAIAHLTDNGTCQKVQTAWIPQAEVEKVIATNIADVELGMEAIAAASDANTVRQLIGGIVTAYTAWITQQHSLIPTDSPNRAEVAQDLLNRAQTANQRIADGLAALDDPQVLEAFRIANRTIATAIRQRLVHKTNDNPQEKKPPKWRPFQLAFILMNLVGLARETHRDRECVDLLFFPTGGGKTEAYLGLAAFTLVLRRLRNPAIQGAGVSVMMRYTLRLLTLDQLGRAATLICALELERQQDIEKLGRYPFEIGLWVGQSATPNVMGKKGENNPESARSKTIAYMNDSQQKPSPIPLENCPWCGSRLTKESFNLIPDTNQPLNLVIKCQNRQKRQDGTPQCVFNRDQIIPIVAVDECIYKRLPCFIIATVDKFASLPWVGSTAALFGKVNRYDQKNHVFSSNGQGDRLDKQLPPPDLIIQDELHLISGPLGTMVGLYETTIEYLCSQAKDGKTILPKIVASTATVRRATRQIQGLFGRTQVDIFPPPGINRLDAFFAKTVPATEQNARLYLGIAAQGRSLKVVLLRTYLALLSAAQKEWKALGGDRKPNNPADPYMTLLGYFNSLRELGGSRRIVEDEVNARLSKYSTRKRLEEKEGLFSDRKINDVPTELTSRETTNKVAATKRRLSLTFDNKDRVDVALATNMISVGLDITRLGLMVVLGQPKTAAEYIQATSRVGRDEQRPGLVVTLLNVHRPRDRSHYERFPFWHTTFYRAVEATSVTPFSPRAIDRGLAGITVALARLGNSDLTSPTRAGEISKYRQDLDFVVETIVNRAIKNFTPENDLLKETIRTRVLDLLDTWESLAEDKGMLQYQQEVGVAPPLIFDFLDSELKKKRENAPEQKFKAGRSLRNVEPTVNLWVRSPDNQDIEDEK